MIQINFTDFFFQRLQLEQRNTGKKRTSHTLKEKFYRWLAQQFKNCIGKGNPFDFPDFFRPSSLFLSLSFLSFFFPSSDNRFPDQSPPVAFLPRHSMVTVHFFLPSMFLTDFFKSTAFSCLWHALAMCPRHISDTNTFSPAACPCFWEVTKTSIETSNEAS